MAKSFEAIQSESPAKHLKDCPWATAIDRGMSSEWSLGDSAKLGEAAKIKRARADAKIGTKGEAKADEAAHIAEINHQIAQDSAMRSLMRKGDEMLITGSDLCAACAGLSIKGMCLGEYIMRNRRKDHPNSAGFNPIDGVPYYIKATRGELTAAVAELEGVQNA